MGIFSSRVQPDSKSSQATALTMEGLEKSDPWVNLQGPKSEAAKKFQGFTYPAFILIDDKHFLPRTLDKNQPGPKLSFGVYGGSIAPRLFLQLKVAGSNLRKTSQMKVEFFPGISGQFDGIEVKRVQKPRRAQEQRSDCKLRQSGNTKEQNISQCSAGNEMEPGSENSGYIKIILHNAGGIGTGLDLDRPDFDLVTKRTIKALRVVTRGRLHSYSIIVEANIHTKDEATAFQSKLKCLITRDPWWPYMRGPGQAMCDYLRMVPRSTVESRSEGLVRYPAENSYATPTEAHIKLSYGIFLEHRHKREQLHKKFEDEDDEEDEEALKKALEKADRFVNCQLKAIAMAYGPNRHEVTDQWMPTLLNHGVLDLSLSGLTGTIPKLTEENFNRVSEKVKQAYCWNKDQLQAIDLCTKELRGRVGMIMGIPGSGRTTTLAGLACLYKLCGAKVIMFAPTVSTARALANKVEDFYTNVLRQSRRDLYILIPGGKMYETLEGGKTPGRPDQKTLMVTTLGTVCYSEIFKNFEKSAERIMVLYDDAFHILEPEMLATIFAIHDISKILGLVCVMDFKEWYTDVSTQTDPSRQMRDLRGRDHYQQFLDFLKGYETRFDACPSNLKDFNPRGQCDLLYGRNEFADQIALSLPARLLRQGFPAAELKKQERMTSELANFPFQRSYKSIQPPPSFTYRDPSIGPAFLNIVLKWLGTKSPRSRVLFVEVPKSFSKKFYGESQSRINKPNAGTVADLLACIYKSDPKMLKEMALITPYSDQRRMYNEMVIPELVKKLSKELRTYITGSDFPEAKSIERMRGHEVKYVIYDIVITAGDKSHGLGIVTDNFFAHVASTRAREMFLIFGSEELLNTFPNFWQCLNEFDGKPHRPLPYIAEYVQTLDSKGLRVEAPEGKGYEGYYDPPEEAYKTGPIGDPIWEKSCSREEAEW